ncbi:hypothetical protein DY000_02007150 [Brassica cretica]|uniref:Uncharacterized protein n=1 Tax=Brassica cretica TaxID=69181 RepID=A0ABQ7C252_BRACR|nr:hypothetical protein DY000_02007150 [Brassica cretica]
MRSQDLRENLRAPPRPLGPCTTSGSPAHLFGHSSNLRVAKNDLLALTKYPGPGQPLYLKVDLGPFPGSSDS